MGDKFKPLLALVGTILLVLLCVELLLGPGRTAGAVIFAVIFLVLLAYAVMRFFKKK